MKNNVVHSVLVSVLMAFLMMSCENKKSTVQDGFNVKGFITGEKMDSIWIKLTHYDYEQKGNPQIIDSVQLFDGKFEFIGKIESPDMVVLDLGSKYYSNFFLENQNIEVELDFKNNLFRNVLVTPKVTGSITHDLHAIYTKKQDSIKNQNKFEPINVLEKEGDIAFSTNNAELIEAYRIKRKGYSGLMDVLAKETDDFKYSYVRSNPASAASPYFIGSFGFSEAFMSHNQMKSFYNLFEGNAKNTAMYKIFTKKYKDVFEKLAIGTKAPDFTLKTNDNKELSLLKVKAKYIFVDFWASWCKPCRASFPHLKELYSKYNKDGFEVVGIATTDKQQKWLKAIEEDKTPWHHVFDKPLEDKPRAMGAVGKSYSVSYLPTTFLLDENMTIIGRNLKKEELDEKLKSLFGY